MSEMVEGAAANSHKLMREKRNLTLTTLPLILLFGFDLTGEVRTQPALKIAREISNF
jgi:hypothetical protein